MFLSYDRKTSLHQKEMEREYGEDEKEGKWGGEIVVIASSVLSVGSSATLGSSYFSSILDLKPAYNFGFFTNSLIDPMMLSNFCSIHAMELLNSCSTCSFYLGGSELQFVSCGTLASSSHEEDSFQLWSMLVIDYRRWFPSPPLWESSGIPTTEPWNRLLLQEAVD